MKHPMPARRGVSEVVGRLGRIPDSDSSKAFLVKAPLRICPIGAHVDHQGGIVTGMTIDRFVFLAAVSDSEPVLRLESLDFPGEVGIDLTGHVPAKSGDWGDYVRAAVSALKQDWPLDTGIRAVIGGDLPGAGLSSSAAVLIAYLLALTRVNGIDLGREGISALVQRAENDYVGVESGRLDQSIILFAERGDLTRVACSDQIIDQVPYPDSGKGFDVLVAFSGVTRALARSDFNTRVEECREAAKILSELVGSPSNDNPVLSEIAPEVFERFAAELPTIPRRRAAHYFGEQRRVLNGIEAWRNGDIERFGSLMTASGSSSIHNYECGTTELVTLYELLRDTPGVFGTRFSGGGFGGSCIALVERKAGERVIEAVKKGYESAHPEAGAAASYHICAPEGPARVEELGG
jgi:galactokinase/galacturonokinase